MSSDKDVLNRDPSDKSQQEDQDLSSPATRGDVMPRPASQITRGGYSAT